VLVVSAAYPAETVEPIVMLFVKRTEAQGICITLTCTLTPTCEYDESICSAAVTMRAVSTITAATFENLYFTRMIYPAAEQTENNNLTNLTINVNSQHTQHDEVGNTWNYTEQNNL